MSDKPSNFEPGDELLSAYLDGELTADERAAVEARLENNPAAQQLLHELRSVSQSVQALPTESLGRDLSEDIIQRARVVREAPVVRDQQAVRDQQVVRGSPDPAPASDRRSPAVTAGPMSKIRVFGSQRAWIWAAMTLAAGLLIMFVQSRDKSSKQLPDVASRNRAPADTQLADDATQPPRRELSVSPPPGMASAPPTSLSVNGEPHDKFSVSGGAMPATPMAGEAGGGQAEIVAHDRASVGPKGIAAASPKLEPRADSDKESMKAGNALSTSTARPDELPKEKAVAPPSAAPTSAIADDALGTSANRKKSEFSASPAAPRLIVVRVAAKPEALENGAFERLLANNKIQFVRESMNNEPLGVGGQLRKSIKDGSSVKDQSNKSPDAHSADVVLVEAPPAAIESCLADLNKNSTDFTSIAVSDTASFSGGFDAKLAPAKKSVEGSRGLSRFSRGDAFSSEKQPFDSRRYLYDSELAKPAGAVASGTPRSGGVADEAGKIAAAERDANGLKALEEQKLLPKGARRARRIERDSGNTGQLDVPAAAPASPALAGDGAVSRQAGAEAYKQPTAERKPNQPAEAKTDKDENWKVLFVFITDEAPAPAASPARQPK